MTITQHSDQLALLPMFSLGGTDENGDVVETISGTFPLDMQVSQKLTQHAIEDLQFMQLATMAQVRGARPTWSVTNIRLPILQT